jgi:lipopolysaccharide export system permease protein
VLVIILPISLFLVVLFTYNKMTVDRELVVAQAAGISQWGLAFPAIVVAVLTTAAAYTLTLYYGPMSVRAFKELQWSVRSDVSQVILREGTFNQVGKGLTIYVRERGPEGDLRGLLVHDNRDEIKSITMMAENGAVVSGPDGPRVILSKGSRQELTRGEGDLTLLYFDRYTVDLGLIELTGDARFKDNRERSTAELFTLSEADGIKPRNIRRMRVEGHQRLTNPLWNLSLAAVALAFILTGTFNRHGQVKRISVAILCTVIIETAGLGAASLASKNLLFVPLLYLVAFVPFGLGLFVLSGKSYQALLPFSLRPHPGSV